MEYDIIEQVSGLSTAGLGLDLKLKRAAALFCKAYPFDQCLIYLRDGKRGFVLKGGHGLVGSRLEAYGEGEGLPGLALKKTNIEITKAAKAQEWEGVEDKGLTGYGYAFVCPLKDKKAVYGVLYLKARKKPSLSALKRRTLAIAAMQLVGLIKCSEMIQSHELVHAEMLSMRQRLEDSEKLLALGDMAATLAHEIRNPLLSIGAFTARLKRHLPPDSPALSYLEQMAAEVRRIEKIMNGIIRFLKDNAVELKPDDLNEILEDALALFSEEFEAHGIRVLRRLSSGALPVLADREQMKIAFDNVIANAIQSMEKGGTLTVSTARSGEFFTASISDTGGGIDPKDLGQIFSPFFTTKRHGTGLGLPISNSILLRHKGMIEVANEKAGAVFTIKLPGRPRGEDRS